MATTKPAVAARTGQEFLDGLRGDAREIWLNGEKITHPLDHPELEAAARSLARVYDLQHEHADEMLAPSPDDGRLVNVSHLIPRSREDLVRRRRAIELTAAATAGMMGRFKEFLCSQKYASAGQYKMQVLVSGSGGFGTAESNEETVNVE